MTSMFDYDDSVNMVFDAKLAGKNLVTAKHELLTKTGDFLFMAHSDRELAFRMQMVEEDIERTAHRRLANVSDSKAKLVRAVFDEWSLRHASCQFCKTAERVVCDVHGCNATAFSKGGTKNVPRCPEHGGNPPTNEQLSESRGKLVERGLLPPKMQSKNSY